MFAMNLQRCHLLLPCFILLIPFSQCFLSSPSRSRNIRGGNHAWLLYAKQDVITPQESSTRPHRHKYFSSRNSTITELDMDMFIPSPSPPIQRNRRHGIARGDGATSDRVCFNKPPEQQDSVEQQQNFAATVKKGTRSKEPFHWVVVSNDTILYLDTTQQPTRENKEVASPRTVAESAFLGKRMLPMKNRQSALELATLLDIPLRSAETMIRKVPSLATTDLLGKIAGRCVEMSIVLRITPREFAAVVKRFPNLLTLKPKKLEKKLMQLDTLLSCSSITRTTLLEDVSERTIATIKRVPRLLAYDVPGTLMNHVNQLSTLLSVEDDTAAMKKILRRCPELLMYRVTQNLLPKLVSLHTLFGLATLDVVKKEPRLLLYSVEESLLPKVQIWKDRVDDAAKFHQLLCRYPSLLLYSRGAAARLEYYAHVNGRKPDATDARQLIMTSKKVVETWGQDLATNKPSLLTGSISKRGRPRRGETVKEAARRRGHRASSHLSLPALSYRQWLEANLVGELSDVQLCVTELGNLERQFGAGAMK